MTTKRANSEGLIDLWYAIPQLLIYLAFQIGPFIIALPIMFTDQIDFLDTDISFVGFDNFAALFSEPLVSRFLPALARTLIFSIMNFLMVFLFGFTLALLMFELSSKLKGMFFTIIYLPWMVSGVGIGMLMLMLFTRDSGTANLLVHDLGGPTNIIDARSELAPLILLPFFVGWKTAGFNMALFLGGLLAIPTETIESSKIDGANYFQRVIHVYIPQMIPSIIIATIFALIFGFGAFDELVGLGGLVGNQSADFLSIFIYDLGFSTSSNMGARSGTLAQGITVSLVVFVPLIVFAYYLNSLQKKFQYN